MRRNTAKRQAQMDRVLAFIRQRQANHLAAPTQMEIARHCGVTQATARKYLLDLERSGQIGRGYHEDGSAIARSIHLTDWEPGQ